MARFNLKKMAYTAGIVIGVLALTTLYLFQHPSIGRLPRGERLERIEQSPNYQNGQFVNLESTVTLLPQGKKRRSVVGNFISHLMEKTPDSLRPSEPVPAVRTDLHTLPLAEDIYLWFGHSSYLLHLDSLRILVDPVLTQRFPMSLMLKPFPGSDIYTPEDIPPIDLLIVTHDHWDHLDYPTIKALRARTQRFVCPLGVGAHLERWGVPTDRIIEMDWGDSLSVKEKLTLHCLPARHFSGRFIKRNKTLWAAFLLDGQHRVFLSGDGGYGKHLAAIGERFGPIHLAIMENGQYNTRWPLIHTLPDQLPTAITDVRAERATTTHHGKFNLARHAWDEPERLIAQRSDSMPYRLLTPVIGQVCHPWE